MAPFESPILLGPEESFAEAVRRVLQYAYPVVLLLTFIIVGASDSIVTAFRKEDINAPKVMGPGGKPLPVTKRKGAAQLVVEDIRYSFPEKAFFQYAMIIATSTFVGVGSDIASRTISHRFASGEHGWWCGEPKTIFIIGSAFLYVYVTLTLFDWTSAPTFVHICTWCLAFTGDLVIFLCDVFVLSGPHKVVVNVPKGLYEVESGPNTWDLVDLGLTSIRVFLLFGLIAVYFSIRTIKKRAQLNRLNTEYRYDPEEHRPLLDSRRNSFHNGYRNGYRANGNGVGHATSNGHAVRNGNGNAPGHAVEEHAGFYRPEKLPHMTWFEYVRGYAVFFPYMWPKKQLRLQVTVIFCVVLLVVQRVINILVPLQIGVVTNELSNENRPIGERIAMPFASIALIGVYKLLQGNSGVIGALRSIMWIPVEQNAYHALTTAAFQHVHSLGLDFHLAKRTGEVLSALNKGSSVNTFLEQVTFQVFPTIVDLFLAISYFFYKFDAVYAMFVCIIVFTYLLITMRMAQSTADQRRAMSNADREEEAVKNDSIISYETVKYFNAEQFEFERYGKAIKNFQDAEAQVTWSISIMKLAQSVIFMIGMMAITMLGAYQVSLGVRKVGDFVALITYLTQLQGPLNFFGTFYRTVQQAMISGERLLELFKQRPIVLDRPGVRDMTECHGRVEFDDVHFAYPSKEPALKGVSFDCAPGTTTALVGLSGGGKSTVFRLLYRYFNTQDGTIRIDGRDVQDFSIESLRRYIGVVPQDAVLFNDTLLYNLQYANQSATVEEIMEACKAAGIHDRIMSMTDGYKSKVGERGAQLSGGEKQRIAIARAILKNPKIIMLDEATSSLDAYSENKFLATMNQMAKGRTVLMIAHRLSTIRYVDQIVFIKDGRIVEKGTHESLVAGKGHYFSLWEAYNKAEEAQQRALKAKEKVDKLNKPAMSRMGSMQSGRNTPDYTSSSDESNSNKKRQATFRGPKRRSSMS